MQIREDEVRHALDNLYDAAALAENPIARRLPQVDARPDPLSRALHLRTVLMEAIEVLQPCRPAAFRSSDARSYEVLSLRFIEGLPMARIAEELHASRRQVYRDLDHAIEGLTKLLALYPWEGKATSTPAFAAPQEPPEPEDVLDDELQSLSPHSGPLDLAPTLQSVVQTVRALAAQCQVNISCSPSDTPYTVFANDALLKQTLVHALSALIRHATGGIVHISTTIRQAAVAVCLAATVDEDLLQDRGFLSAQKLAEVQDLAWCQEPLDQGRLQLVLELPPRESRVVLVIEDNRGAVELYKRYLASSREWQVVVAPSPRLSFDMARRYRPAVIILDILMSEQDGWSVLQLLQAQPETRDIPILVCSVFEELDLAATLGATAYLRKPVSQLQLLAALQRCLSH
ncbi:MAG: response regulator [Anaerolineae bacterium]|nr:response regulator [Anaerolineae bacterium]